MEVVQEETSDELAAARQAPLTTLESLIDHHASSGARRGERLRRRPGSTDLVGRSSLASLLDLLDDVAVAPTTADAWVQECGLTEAATRRRAQFSHALAQPTLVS